MLPANQGCPPLSSHSEDITPSALPFCLQNLHSRSLLPLILGPVSPWLRGGQQSQLEPHPSPCQPDCPGF